MGSSPEANTTATYAVIPPSPPMETPTTMRVADYVTLRQMVLLTHHRGWFVGFVYRREGTKKISDNQHVVGGIIMLPSIWKQNSVSEKNGHNNLYQVVDCCLPSLPEEDH